MICYTVPSPQVTIYLSKEGPYIAGTTVDLICIVTVDTNQLNTPYTIQHANVKGKDDPDFNRQFDTFTSINSTSNKSVLHFDTLCSTEDTGDYICSVIIGSTSEYPFLSTTNNSESLFLNISGNTLCHVINKINISFRSTNIQLLTES